MKEFKKWFQKEKTKYSYRPINEIDCGMGWSSALRWHRNTATECEKDCSTDKDYRVLYFHLKQVLENEIIH